MQKQIISMLAGLALQSSALQAKAENHYGINITTSIYDTNVSWQSFTDNRDKLSAEHKIQELGLVLDSGMYFDLSNSQDLSLNFMALIGSDIEYTQELHVTSQLGLFRKDMNYLGFGFYLEKANYKLAYDLGLSLNLLSPGDIQARILTEISLKTANFNLGSFVQLQGENIEKYWVYVLFPINSRWALGAIFYNNTPMLFCKLL